MEKDKNTLNYNQVGYFKSDFHAFNLRYDQPSDLFRIVGEVDVQIVGRTTTDIYGQFWKQKNWNKGGNFWQQSAKPNSEG